MTEPIHATIAELSLVDELIVIDHEEEADLHAAFVAHEGAIVNGRRLVRIGLSDDGRDSLWQFVRTDGPR